MVESQEIKKERNRERKNVRRLASEKMRSVLPEIADDKRLTE